MRIRLIICFIAAGFGLMLALNSGALMFQSTGPLNAAGEGRRQFLKNNCYGCHGGRGGGGMGPNLRGGDVDVEEAVQGLPGGMPAFRNLTETDINNLEAYIRSLRTP